MLYSPTRRKLLTGLSAILAAPAIVRASFIMPVKPLKTVKQHVGNRCATELIIDGMKLDTKDSMFLLRWQATPSMNGIYTVSVFSDVFKD